MSKENEYIECPHCGHVNPPGTQLCQSCGLLINDDYDKKKIKDVMRYDGSAVRSKVKSSSLFDKIWIFFTSIRNGVIIIALIAIASAIGTILPQEYFIPVGVDAADYYKEHYGTFGTLYYNLGFHNLYSSWWFLLLNAMLALSIIAASIDRGVPLFKSLKNQGVKKHPSYYKRQRIYLHNEEASKDDVESLVKDLEKKRYKVRKEENSYLLEKGRLSRYGPYINHTGLIILLIGSMLRFFPGMYLDELVYAPEGETVKLPGTDSKYYIKNDEFIIDTYDKDAGTVFDKSLENQEALASNYQTNITFYENETSDIVGSEPELKEVDRAEIKVNHPFKFDGYHLYQSSFDNSAMKSMTFEIQDDDGNVISEPFEINLKDPEEEFTIKGTDNTDFDIRLRAYAPDFLEIGSNGGLISQTPVPRNPAFIFEVKDNDNNEEYSLIQIQDTTEITEDNMYNVKFVSMENEMSSVLTLKKDKTLFLIASGFIIFLIGVFIGSYVNHRRIWINSDNGLTLAAHTNRNYYSISKEINEILEKRNLGEVVDSDSKVHDERMKG
ncbi:MAG TPA: cytochrome c biogenesis protein ResB [Candidatus Nosocomiicoccus stercorigallinarum]|nr:cytochrome c biogenesis protein ResB [Candidatus Nosocomiicoccus stercorigallinarum]